MDVNALIEQLKGIRCHSTLRQRANNKNIKVLSCPDAIGRVLEKVMKMRESQCRNAQCADEPIIPAPSPDNGADCAHPASAGLPCPECGNEMEHEGGCVICRACGYSKCG